MRCGLRAAGSTSTPPAVSDLLSLLEAWRLLIASMHACKFACIEAGDNEAFELLDAVQRSQQVEFEKLAGRLEAFDRRTGGCNSAD